MPRGAVDSKHLFTFIRGLVTEATGITYPENSMIDGENVIVDVSGVCKRRPGMDYEELYELCEPRLTETEFNTHAITFHRWEAVNNVGENNLWVIQVGVKLFIGDLSQTTLSTGYIGMYDLSTLQATYPREFGQSPKKLPFVIDDEKAPLYPISSTYGKGRLFCNSKYMNPFFLEVDDETGKLEVKMILIQERDLEGLEDGFAVNVQPLQSQNTPEHTYNLKNQGWNDTELVATSDQGRTILETGNGVTEGRESGGAGGGGGSYDPLDITFINDLINLGRGF